MKRTFILFGVILIAFTMNAQSFTKGTNTIELDFGLGVYNNVTNNVNFNGFTARGKGNAASSIIGLQYERGVTDVLALGIRIDSQNYLDSTGNNDLDNASGTKFSIGAGIKL